MCDNEILQQHTKLEHCVHLDVTLATYRHAVRNGSDIAFVCVRCKVGQPSPDVSFDVADVSFDRTGGAHESNIF